MLPRVLFEGSRADPCTDALVYARDLPRAATQISAGRILKEAPQLSETGFEPEIERAAGIDLGGGSRLRDERLADLELGLP